VGRDRLPFYENYKLALFIFFGLSKNGI